MFNFIEEYLRLTEDLETPTSYLKWGAISCIGAALRDNFYFKFPARQEKIYPNTYILLLGDTSAVRKSNPLNVTRKLLKKLDNTKVVAGAASMQGILKELGSTMNGKPKGGSGIMLAKELEAYFVKDPATIGILTDLYDFHEIYEKILSTQDTIIIRNVCLSLFGGSNEIMMRKLIDQSAVEGGLVGRMLIIEEVERRKNNSGFEDNQIIITDEHWEPCSKFLNRLKTFTNVELKFTENARKHYNEWYHSLPELQKRVKTGTGFEYRLHTHVLKVATILAASIENFVGTIELEFLESAILECGKLIPTYQKLTLGSGSHQDSPAMGHVVLGIVNSPNHEISHRDLLYKLFGICDTEMLNRIITTLEQAELIKQKSVRMIPGYKATDKLVEKVLYKNQENDKSKWTVN